MTAYSDLQDLVYQRRAELRLAQPQIIQLNHRLKAYIGIAATTQNGDKTFLGWHEWRLTKVELQRIHTQVAESNPYYEDFTFTLQTTADCVVFDDSLRDDITRHVRAINLGE